MLKFISGLSLCGLLVGCQSLTPPQTHTSHDHQALAAVHTIYVTELRDETRGDRIVQSNEIRELIQNGLGQSTRFAIVQDPLHADAVLTGVAGVEFWYHGMEDYYGAEGDLDGHELGIGRLRLEDAKTKKVIWTFEYETGFLRPKQSVAERVAAQVADRLVQDTLQADKPR